MPWPLRITNWTNKLIFIFERPRRDCPTLLKVDATEVSALGMSFLRSLDIKVLQKTYGYEKTKQTVLLKLCLTTKSGENWDVAFSFDDAKEAQYSKQNDSQLCSRRFRIECAHNLIHSIQFWQYQKKLNVRSKMIVSSSALVFA